MSKSVITPKAMLSFPQLHEAKPNQQGLLQFSAQLVFITGTEMKEIQAEIVRVAIEKWGQDKAVKGLKTGALYNPLRTDWEAKGLPEDAVFFTARTKIQPHFVYNFRDPATGKAAKVKPEDVQQKFYPGAIVRAEVVFYAFERPEKKGVGVALNNMQLLDGTTPRLDGRKAAEDVFEAAAMAGPADLSDLE